MKPTKSVLLIGFEPFGGDAVNPSQAIVEALHGRRIADHRIVGRLLPVAFGRTANLIEGWIDEVRPGLVVALGQAGGRSELSLERVAINLIDARIPDNDGEQPVDVAVLDGATDGRFSTLPLKRILLALRDAGIPVALSQTAGTYVCNQVFFLIAESLTRRGEYVRSGFIHVPWLPEQAAVHSGQASMALDTMLAGVRLALSVSLRHDDDVAVAGGSTH